MRSCNRGHACRSAAAHTPAVIDWLVDHGAHPDHGMPSMSDGDHNDTAELSPLCVVQTAEAAAALLARGADVNFRCACSSLDPGTLAHLR